VIVIIGAGPAGLGASYFATRNCTVIEAEADLGGLCRSFEVGGCTFDLGGHAFFTRHQDILSLIEKTVPDGLYAQPRQAFVHCDGALLRYPFQANLFGCRMPDRRRRSGGGARTRTRKP
jgi:UDP-galactopyranose mutase